MQNNQNPSKYYFLFGLGCGVLGTLLFAPRLREVREEIAGAVFLVGRKFGNELKDELTGRTYEVLHEVTNDLAETGRKMASSVLEETKEKLITSTERLSEAIEVGKQAYLEEKHRAE